MKAIQCAYECLKRIAAEVAVVRIGTPAGKNKVTDTHFLGELVERLTLNELGTCVGKETLTLTGKMAIDDVAHSTIEHGIPQKLQALIVDGLALIITVADTFVQQCCLIISDVVGIEADNGI